MCLCHIETFINKSHIFFYGVRLMSDKETTVEEWKTIRIPATSYYRLAELSGLLTAVLGTRIPMSVIANWAVIVYHDEYYPRLRKLMMNPDLIEQARKEWKEYEGKLKRLFEVLTKPKYE